MNHSKAISELLVHTARAKIAELTEQVVMVVGRVVQAGPFKGMKLPETSSWGDGDILPKILGTYEQELNVSIETCIARKPEVVMNIGCAEGYYAVGLAMRMPDVWVYAYDTDVKAVMLCGESARINSAELVNISLDCHILPGIKDLRDKKSLYLIDCEGAELQYVENPANFVKADLIIECHEFADKNAVQILTERLSATHDITYVKEGPRDPSSIALLQGLNTLERYCAVCEMRPSVMQWLVALAKSRN